VEAKLDRTWVHIVDDDATFRKTIAGRLQQFGYEAVTYPSAQHLLDRLPSDAAPSCILLDVRMPLMSGPELQERLGELGSTLPIIFVTGDPDIPTTVRTIKAGGVDFLIKPVSSEQLLDAVERAVAHHNAVLRQKQARDVAFSRIATLTPRERQVFDLVIRGKNNKAIANVLGPTERTIKERSSELESPPALPAVHQPEGRPANPNSEYARHAAPQSLDPYGRSSPARNCGVTMLRRVMLNPLF
jgi:FixJ family two-component response regulator